MTERRTSSPLPACYNLPLELAQSSGCPTCKFIAGAAIAFGLMGMAEAIKARPGIHGHWCAWCHQDITLAAGYAVFAGQTFCGPDCLELWEHHT